LKPYTRLTGWPGAVHLHLRASAGERDRLAVAEFEFNSAAPFRDRVVHHALCKVIEPIWESRFIDQSYACRVGGGTHKALDQCQAWMHQYPYRFMMASGGRP